MVSLMFVIMLAGCGNGTSKEAPQIICYNGTFTGTVEDNGVESFKGIPYAQAPTGELRWKAPQPVEKSDEIFAADSYGKAAIQYETFSVPASFNEKGEDCLSLNIWTKDIKTKGKAVMVYIHGGGFNWGSSSDDDHFSGRYIAEDNEDVAVVTINYRLGMYGLIDFSKVPGGEEYKESTYLSVLDIIQALKWIKQNAESFGGDPENIMVFGESAGGAYVSYLMACEQAEGLFNHAIAQSGSLNLTFSQEQYDELGLTELLLEKTGAKNMKDLIAIPEEELEEIYTSYDEEGICLNDFVNMPLRGGNGLVPEDPYEALREGVNRDVDFITGTNSDEWRYWINETGEKPVTEMDEEGVEQNKAIYEEYIVGAKYQKAMSIASSEEKKNIKKFLSICGEDEKIWQYTELANETAFRVPSIDTAYAHASAGGNTYMYYFEKEKDDMDFFGSCHAAELPYVFNRADGTGYSETVDKDLAGKISRMWAQFARTGDPSIKEFEWKQYSVSKRETLDVGNDNSLIMVNDPLSEQRKLIEPFVKYYLN